jgi:hypothetical protein
MTQNKTHKGVIPHECNPPMAIPPGTEIHCTTKAYYSFLLTHVVVPSWMRLDRVFSGNFEGSVIEGPISVGSGMSQWRVDVPAAMPGIDLAISATNVENEVRDFSYMTWMGRTTRESES